MSDIIKSAENLMESQTTDLIVAGGPSSSEIINRLRESSIHDLLELGRRTEEQTERIDQAETIFASQASSLATAISSLSARLPTTAGRWMADFYTSDFIYTGTGGNEAEISTLYGQATLPILSTQDKLVSEDERGNIWVPKTSQVHYAYQTGTPVESEWLTDEDYTRALDQRSDTAWWRTRGSAGYVWVRFRVPANLNANKLANCIRIHPYPVLAWDLYSVEYRNPAGVWSSVDLSYVEGWDGTKIQWCPNMRLFFPQTQVVEVRLKLYTEAQWGFGDVRLQQVEFSPTAALVVDFSSYSPGTVGEAALFGKDQDGLAYLGTQINSTRVTVDLTQTTENSTPVVVGIEVRT